MFVFCVCACMCVCVCVCFVTGLRVACFAFACVADGVNCFLGGCAERLSQGIV